MRKLVLALGLAAALLGTGCFNHVMYDSQAIPESEPVYDHWQHHILYGIATLSPPIDFRQLCPYGVAQVEDYISFANFLVSFFTAFIYTPSNLEVYCAVAKQVIMVPPTAGPPPSDPQLPGVVVLPPTPTPGDTGEGVVVSPQDAPPP